MAITVLASTQQLQNDLDKWVRRDGEGNENGEMEKTVKQKKKKKSGMLSVNFIYQLKIHTDWLEQLSGVEFVFCHLMCWRH